MSEVKRMYFEREVIGTPENCKRVWSAMVVHDREMTGITLWQDGPWWCMTEETNSKICSSTWGNAQHIMQELAMYGRQVIIDHIDFNASNFNVG
jgi:hypothetical protein